MSQISRTWKKAGSAPGQYQRLTIKFIKRDGDDVKCSATLYAKSLGWDSYTTRYNKAIISCLGKVRCSWTYQLRGTRTSKTYYPDPFWVRGVANKDDDLIFYYKNERHWDGNTNPSDPRSTGVVGTSKVGELTIPKNTKHVIQFNELVTEEDHQYKCWHEDDFTIPEKEPKEHHFNFKGWTDENYAKGHEDEGIFIPPDVLNSGTKKAKYAPGKKIKNVKKDLDFYAVWRPKTCKYKYQNYDSKEITDLGTKYTLHTWNTDTLLPDLDKVNGGKYKVPGYTFKGWEYRRYIKSAEVVRTALYKAGALVNLWPSTNSDVDYVRFYASNTPKSNQIIFHFPNNDIVFDKASGNGYYTDTKFTMKTALNKYFDIVSPNLSRDLNTQITNVKLGYKLVGWSTSPPSVVFKNAWGTNGIANPTEAFNPPNTKLTKKDVEGYASYYKANGFKVYPTSGTIQKFIYDDFIAQDSEQPVLNLYPYFEYYTTTYVYTEEGWKLAMPYVYTENGWKMALTYIYTENGWKL